MGREGSGTKHNHKGQAKKKYRAITAVHARHASCPMSLTVFCCNHQFVCTSYLSWNYWHWFLLLSTKGNHKEELELTSITGNSPWQNFISVSMIDPTSWSRCDLSVSESDCSRGLEHTHTHTCSHLYLRDKYSHHLNTLQNPSVLAFVCHVSSHFLTSQISSELCY